MTSNISMSSPIGDGGASQVQMRIGSMGTDRDLSQYDFSTPVPRTMEEFRAKQPKVYQEMLLQAFETMNILLKEQLKKSEEQWKENGRPK